MANQRPRGQCWLFDNDRRKTDKHPTHQGNGVIPRDLLKQLVDQIKVQEDSSEVKVRLAAWPRVSKNGNNYLSITIELDRPKEDRRPEPAVTPERSSSSETSNSQTESEEDLPF